MTVEGGDLRVLIESALRRRFSIEWIIVGAEDPSGSALHADEATVARAREAVKTAACVISVGSGTLTDIAKAAAPDGIPLICVQTAASVNGYADPFSVLLKDGVKRTTPTRWPDALLIDPAVLASAPPDLNRAGVGDSMAMFTSSADWYLASVVAPGGEPVYRPAVTDLSRAHGDRLLALADGLAGEQVTDPGRLAELARILTLSGIAMGVAGSTAPASGMEHAISHLLEMAAGARGDAGSFHGTQVGVGSVVAAATWAHVRGRIAAGALGRPAQLPDPDRAAERITAAFAAIDPTGAMAAECFADYSRKLSRLAAAGDPLDDLRKSWPEHEAALDSLLASPDQIAAGLTAAGLPATFGGLPEQVSDSDARWAVATCHLMRHRLGVADLAVLIGAWTDDDIDQVLADATRAGGAA
jgi:glycerol-1-phosphate dehydrogenase [NAD(P)+]